MIKFTDIGLKEELVKALDDLGFETPTPIQEKAIPFILNNDRDLVALAQTGTGKTAAFSLPVLENIDTKSKEIQVLILSPTRELAIQIQKDNNNYTKYLRGFRSVAVYGGAAIINQIRDIEKGVQMVVGTPGRMIDLIKRRKLDFSKVRYVVLDEADEMLNMGFKEDLDFILEKTPEQKQILLFSATMPKEIRRIAQVYMNDPEEIAVAKTNQGASNVEHIFYAVRPRERYATVKRLVDATPSIYGIIFCRTRRETKEIADSLMNEGYSADAIHGDLSQAQRDYVMGRFRGKSIQILVATDVAARGIDISDLTHVINYNLPDDNEVYVHRSGRTGRAGKKGVSVVIVSGREKGKIKRIEKMIGKTFSQGSVPTGKDICAKQLLHLVDKVKSTEVNENEIKEYLPLVYEKLEDLSREELIQHFISVEFNRFLSYYEKEGDIKDSSRNDGGRDRRSTPDSHQRFFINLGSKDNINTVGMIGLINDITQLKNADIGEVAIMKNFSFFEFEKKYADDLLKAFENETFEGRAINVEKATSEGGGGSREKRSNNRRRGGERRGGGDRRGRSSFRDKKRSYGGGDRRGKFSGNRRSSDSEGGGSRSERTRRERRTKR